MKQYEIQTVMSGGGRLYDPLNAEDVEAVKKVIAEKRSSVEKELSEVDPDETIVAIEIYELAKVAAVNVKPRVV